MRENAHRTGFLRDLVVDIDIKASRRRFGAERADLRRAPLQARRGHASAKKPRGKAVRGGRGPQMKKKCQISLRTMVSMFTCTKLQLFLGEGCSAFLRRIFELLPC